MVKYILNNKIVFFPQEKAIESIKDGTRYTMLLSSARCFELLLERQGGIVSHSELLIAGWGGDAKRTVSNSAYYQSFVNLRNILKKLGCQDDILMTVRGRGIRLNAYVTVERHEDKPKINTKNTNPVREAVGNHPSAEQLNDNTVEMAPDISTMEISAQHEKGKSVFGGKNTIIKSIRFYLAILILALCILTYVLYENYFNDDYILRGYSHVQDTPPCYFVNSRNINNDFAIDFVVDQGLVCTKDIKYYISYFSTSPRLTVFKCGKDASMKCDSITYIVDENKNEKN